MSVEADVRGKAFRALVKECTVLSNREWNPKLQKFSHPKKILFFGSSAEGARLRLPFWRGKKLLGLPELPEGNRRSRMHFQGELFGRQQSVVARMLHLLREERCVTGNVYTGGGKTVMACYISCYVKRRVCVLCHSVSQARCWKNSFDKFTTARCILLSASPEPELFSEEVDVVACYFARARHIPEDFLRSVEVLVVDEADVFCTQIRAEILLQFAPLYVICLTATYERKDGLHKMLDLLCGAGNRVRVRKNTNMSYAPLFTGYVPQTSASEWSNFLEELSHAPERLQLLLSFVKEKISTGRKVLVMAKRTATVENLCSLLREDGVSCGEFFGNMSRYDESMCLVSTLGKTGRGFDESSFSSEFNGTRLGVLLCCDTTRSPTELEQMVGRVERSASPEVFFAVDENAVSLRHWRWISSWLQDFYGARPEPPPSLPIFSHTSTESGCLSLAPGASRPPEPS